MNFYTVLTNSGINAIIKARASNEEVKLSTIAVGDGEIVPSQIMEGLQSEKHRFNINTITQDSTNPGYLVIEGIIPSTVGGFYISEVALYTDDNILFAIGSLPRTYKPLLEEGSAKDLTIKMIIEVTNADSVSLKIDDSVVLASRKFVEDTLENYMLTSNAVSKTEFETMLASYSLINKPTIISPANFTTDYIGAVTSTYNPTNSYEGLQTKAVWECALDDSFNDIIDEYVGSDNLTSWTPTIGLPLTQVFIRTKQISDGHISEYSEVISFTTPNTFIETPTITVEGTPNDVLKNPTISGSAFSVMNGTDTHASTDWQVLKASDSSVVWESLNDTQNLLSITIGTLPIDTDLVFRVRYKGAVYGSSTWVEVTAKTLNIYVENPTLTVEGTPSLIGDKPVLTSSAFSVFNGTDTHLSTDWVIEQSGTEVWSSMGDTTNKLSITVPAGYLVESTEYTFKVRHNGNTYGSSSYATVTGTTKDEFFSFDSDFGKELEGGYYAGKIQRADGVYALIVAPKALGYGGTKMWKDTKTTSGGCKSLNNGAINTAHMVASGRASVYPAAHYCNDLVINGYSDWYLPARDELEIAYRNLKPTTEPNSVSNRGRPTYLYTDTDDGATNTMGMNSHSIPAGVAYTTSNPSQTTLAPFKQGGAETFYVDLTSIYLSSTEYSSTDAWHQYLSHGQQSGNPMITAYFVRAFRAVKIS